MRIRCVACHGQHYDGSDCQETGTRVNQYELKDGPYGDWAVHCMCDACHSTGGRLPQYAPQQDCGPHCQHPYGKLKTPLDENRPIVVFLLETGGMCSYPGCGSTVHDVMEHGITWHGLSRDHKRQSPDDTDKALAALRSTVTAEPSESS